MVIRYPIEYRLSPSKIPQAMRWLTLTVKNVGEKGLTALDVRLNSLDEYALRVIGTGMYVTRLDPGEETVRAFRVTADLSGRVYASLDGWRDGDQFHWESPGWLITVGEEVAELVSVFALSEPYPPPGRKLRCQATVRGLKDSEALTLEFWVQTPAGEFEELGVETTGKLAAGDEATYPVEMTPADEGSYTLHAYLYDSDGTRRIGHAMDYVYVVNP